MRPPERPPAASPPSGPDLSRLRIERSGVPLKPYRGFPVVGVLLLLAAVAGLWLLREPLLGLARGAGAPEVKLATVERIVPGRAAPGDVAANGYVVADRMASLATALSGRLVEIHAREGDTVEENAVVARIQYDDLEAQRDVAKQRVEVARKRVEAATADLAAARLEYPQIDARIEAETRLADEAQVTLERLERDVERNAPLYEARRIDEGTWDRLRADARGARDAWRAALARVEASRAERAAWEGEVERRSRALAVGEAEVEAARGDLEVAELLVEKTRIRAPFRGLVIRKDAELGEVIAPTGAGNSRGSVFTIVDPSSLEVQVELSERRILAVQEGDLATVFLDASPDTGHAGSVRKIWPRADRSKGTIEVRVRFDERPLLARPEMSVRVVFRGKQAEVAGEPYLALPPRAVVRRGGDTHVFVLEGGKAQWRVVRLGERRDAMETVLGGLEAGERVILDPPSDLEDGQAVRTGEQP